MAYKKTHTTTADATATSPAINTEKAGSLAPKAVKAELMTNRSNSHTSLEGLLEKVGGLVSSFTSKSEDSITATENAVTALMDGSLTINELSSQYGEMTRSEASEKKAQLERVMNSIGVAIEKTHTEREGIKLSKEKALTTLAGLKAAFQIQSETEKVADAQSESLYQMDKHSVKNDSRNQDISFRIDRNRLIGEDNQSALAHKTEMNAIDDRIRQAVRRGATATLNLKNFNADQRETATSRILGKIEEKTKAKGGKK